MKNILNRFLRKKAPAQVAKERLQIIIAHERNRKSNKPDYLEKLQREIVEVIAKYVDIDQNQVHVQLQRSGGSAVLELNVAMPEEVFKGKEELA